MSTLEFKASNIKCGGCAANIKKALQPLAGVQQVDVDVPSGTVRVAGDAVDATLVRKTLASIGYPPKSE